PNWRWPRGWGCPHRAAHRRAGIPPCCRWSRTPPSTADRTSRSAGRTGTRRASNPDAARPQVGDPVDVRSEPGPRPHLEVQMRARAVAGGAGPADALPRADGLTVPHGDRRQVRVLAVAAVAVADHDLIAERPLPAGAHHGARRDRLHRRAGGDGEVDPRVVALRPGGSGLVVRRAGGGADGSDPF